MTFEPATIELTSNIHSHFEAFRIINANFEKVSNDLTNLSSGLSGGFDHYKSALTGGDFPALDSIDGARMEVNQRALVVEGSNPARVFIYVAASDPGAAEDVPWVIVPDTNASDMRWILAARIPRLWKGSAAPTFMDDTLKGVTTGDLWLSNGDFWICSSDEVSAARWVKVLKIGTSAGHACDADDPRLPTSAQKEAMTGTSGIPGDNNRYVTDGDIRLSDARSPTAHVHGLAEMDCGLVTEADAPIVVG